MSTTPLSPTSAGPSDPELRDRYRRDAELARERRRAVEAARAAEVRPSRTPSGPIKLVAALVTVLLVAGLGIAMLGPMLQQDETTEQALPADLSSLEVRSDVGEVRVRVAGPGEEPGVTRTVRSGLLSPDTSVEASGGRATLTGECPEIGTVCRIDWLVVVPEDTETRISQGVGAVAVEGLSGDVDVDAGVGDVAVSEVTARTVSVDLGVGDLDIDAAEPPRRVTGHVGVGDLTVRVPGDVPYRVETHSQGADNQLGSDPSAPRTIVAETGVGGLTVQPN